MLRGNVCVSPTAFSLYLWHEKSSRKRCSRKTRLNTSAKRLLRRSLNVVSMHPKERGVEKDEKYQEAGLVLDKTENCCLNLQLL